jgi:deoxycytidylate deaminase
MHYLDRFELGVAEMMAGIARAEAIQSPDSGNKRGAVLAAGYDILGRGHNAPPPGYGLPTVCAEMNALLDALNRRTWMRGGRVYSINTVDDLVIRSPPPSCVDCSKNLLTAGIEGVVLWNGEEGFAFYPAKELLYLSLAHKHGAEFANNVRKR